MHSKMNYTFFSYLMNFSMNGIKILKLHFLIFFFLLQDIFTKTWQKNTNLQYHDILQQNGTHRVRHFRS